VISSKKHRAKIIFLAALAVSLPGRALAQTEFGATAVVDSPIAAVQDEDATASGSEITLTERAAAGESVADAIAEAPGARSFRTGPLGSFTSASLRGADSEQTAILLGDLPISRADASAFNLDTMPASMLDSVVVYRGGAPVWLSQGEIGGLIQLVPKRAHHSLVSGEATAGSFGLLDVRGETAVNRSDDLPSIYTSAAISSSKGNFNYLSDNSTSLNPSDDYVTERRNADALDGHGFLYLRAPVASGALDVALLGFQRLAGEPGSVANPAFQTRRNHSRYLATASYQQSQQAPEKYRLYRFELLAATSYEQTRFTDLYKEIGVFPSATDDRSGNVYLRAAGSRAIFDFFELTALGSARYETFSRDDPLARSPLLPSTRWTLAGAVETNVHGKLAGRRFELRPSLRYQYSQAALNSAERFGERNASRAKTSSPTYRIAGVLEISRGVAASASAATGKRIPSILELFGDGGFLLGNPSLSQERSVSFDTGMVVQGQLGQVWGSAEVRLFSLHIEDRVIYVANSLHELVPLNLRSSKIYGVEIGIRGNASRHFRLCTSATLMDTEGKPGRQLPNRARMVTQARPEVILGPFSYLDAWTLFVESSYVSPTYDDAENATLPKLGVFVADAGVLFEAFSKAWQLRFTVRDLFDRQGQDVRGYQLPGRTFLGSLTYRKDL
jgi:iron complex outermembrane receptor protein